MGNGRFCFIVERLISSSDRARRGMDLAMFGSTTSHSREPVGPPWKSSSICDSKTKDK